MTTPFAKSAVVLLYSITTRLNCDNFLTIHRFSLNKKHQLLCLIALIINGFLSCWLNGEAIEDSGGSYGSQLT
jgi:hypothetical protein